MNVFYIVTNQKKNVLNIVTFFIIFLLKQVAKGQFITL